MATDNKLYTISFPTYDDTNFGEKLADVFNNIDSNFQKLANLRLTTGKDGEAASWLVFDLDAIFCKVEGDSFVQGAVPLDMRTVKSIKSTYTAFNAATGLSKTEYRDNCVHFYKAIQAAIQEGFSGGAGDAETAANDDIKRLWVEWNDAGTDPAADSITANAYKDFMPGKLAVAYNPGETFKPIGSMIYVFADPRFRRQDVKPSSLAELQDSSCALYGEASADGLKFNVVDAYPRLYWDGEFKLIINGTQTNIPVAGKSGAKGDTSGIAFVRRRESPSVDNYYKITGTLQQPENDGDATPYIGWPAFVFPGADSVKSPYETLFWVTYLESDGAGGVKAFCSDQNLVEIKLYDHSFGGAMMGLDVYEQVQEVPSGNTPWYKPRGYMLPISNKKTPMSNNDGSALPAHIIYSTDKQSGGSAAAARKELHFNTIADYRKIGQKYDENSVTAPYIPDNEAGPGAAKAVEKDCKIIIDSPAYESITAPKFVKEGYDGDSGNRYVLLANGGVGTYSMPLGYYYSPVELYVRKDSGTGKIENNFNKISEYIGISREGFTADNPGSHRYIYLIESETKNPTKIDEYIIPVYGQVYLLSSEISGGLEDIKNPAAGETVKNVFVPSGRVAKFGYSQSGPNLVTVERANKDFGTYFSKTDQSKAWSYKPNRKLDFSFTDTSKYSQNNNGKYIQVDGQFQKVLDSNRYREVTAGKYAPDYNGKFVKIKGEYKKLGSSECQLYYAYNQEFGTWLNNYEGAAWPWDTSGDPNGWDIRTKEAVTQFNKARQGYAYLWIWNGNYSNWSNDKGDYDYWTHKAFAASTVTNQQYIKYNSRVDSKSFLLTPSAGTDCYAWIDTSNITLNESNLQQYEFGNIVSIGDSSIQPILSRDRYLIKDLDYPSRTGSWWNDGSALQDLSSEIQNNRYLIKSGAISGEDEVLEERPVQELTLDYCGGGYWFQWKYIWDNPELLTLYWRYIMGVIIESDAAAAPIVDNYTPRIGWNIGYKPIQINSRGSDAMFSMNIYTEPTSQDDGLFGGEVYMKITQSPFTIQGRYVNIQGVISMMVGGFGDCSSETYDNLRIVHNEIKSRNGTALKLPNIIITDLRATISKTGLISDGGEGRNCWAASAPYVPDSGNLSELRWLGNTWSYVYNPPDTWYYNPISEGETKQLMPVSSSGGGGSIKPTLTIDPTGGPQDHTRVDVTLTALPGSSRIYYTKNGMTPNESSTPYSGPFRIDSTQATTVVVKAIAVYNGTYSDVVTATYKFPSMSGEYIIIQPNSGSTLAGVGFDNNNETSTI